MNTLMACTLSPRRSTQPLALIGTGTFLCKDVGVDTIPLNGKAFQHLATRGILNKNAIDQIEEVYNLGILETLDSVATFW